jgi:hypothetical protein
MWFHVDGSIVFIFRRSLVRLCTAVIELFSWLVYANCLLDIICLSPIVRVSSESRRTKCRKSKVRTIQIINSWRWKKRIISFAFWHVRFAFIIFFLRLFVNGSELHSFGLKLGIVGSAGVCIKSIASSFLRFRDRKLSILRCPRIYHAIIFSSLSSHADCCKTAPVLPSFTLGNPELVSKIGRRIVLF